MRARHLPLNLLQHTLVYLFSGEERSEDGQALGIEPRHLDLLIDSIIGGRGVDRHPRQRQIQETVMLYRDPHRDPQAHHLRTGGGIGDLIGHLGNDHGR